MSYDKKRDNVQLQRSSSMNWKCLVVALWNLLFPRGCSGCCAADYVLCSSCWQCFDNWQVLKNSQTLMGYCYACAVYQENVKRAILAWKDHQDVACDRPFGQALSALILAVIVPQLRKYHIRRMLIVPLPSSRRSVRQRGRYHLDPLVSMIVKQLQNAGIQSCVVHALAMSRQIRKKSVQTMGGARARAQRSADAFVLTKDCLRGSTVIVVDDIMTTGSTMNAGIKVLRSAGVHVLSGVVLACAHCAEAHAVALSSVSSSASCF